MIIKAITGVTGTGAISMMNKVNKHTKALIRMCLLSIKFGTLRLLYRLFANCKNHLGRIITTYMPIKHPGEIGPKPIMAKMANTAIHFI